MHIRTVSSVHGWLWIREGFRLFLLAPGPWVLLWLIFLGVLMLAPWIPLVGGLISLLLQPVMTGGLMQGCRELDLGGELKITTLFTGLSRKNYPLVLLGVYSALVSLVVFAPLLASLLKAGWSEVQQFPDSILHSDSMWPLSLLLPILFSLLLMLPLVLATWFAPALVQLDQQTPLSAMRMSLEGCWNNSMAFLVYGLVTMLLMLLALISVGLGILVVGPVLIASIYAGYRDIFEAKEIDGAS
jgi:hypothetical protein